MTTLDMMRSLRAKGWCVVLKCLPKEMSWIIEGSRSEYDAPCPDLKTGKDKWCCEAQWMGRDFRHTPFALQKTAKRAVEAVFQECMGRKQ